jgi:hypothetical protein
MRSPQRLRTTLGPHRLLAARVAAWGESCAFTDPAKLAAVVEVAVTRFELLPRWQRVGVSALLAVGAPVRFGTLPSVLAVADRWVQVTASSAAVEILIRERNTPSSNRTRR